MSDVAFFIRRLLRTHGREAFLHEVETNGSVLDVGCGSDTPYIIKSQRPDLRYFGIDVGDYRQKHPVESIAEKYIICEPEVFAETISSCGNDFDAVISSHNIEHCNEPKATLREMIRSLRPGGRLYIAWPAEHTAKLPSRTGCLNFFDDPTHRAIVPFDFVLETCRAAGCRVLYSSRAYRPLIPLLLGAILEPFSALTKRVMPMRSTWALYGFEAVAWFEKQA